MFSTMKADFISLSVLWKTWLFIGLFAVLFANFYNFTCFTLLSIVGLFAGLAGVLYVVYAANDKKSTMIFGIIMVLLYGVTALVYGIYGDAIQNLLYQFPILISGLLMFDKNESKDKEVSFVEKISTKLNRVDCIMLYIFLIVSYGIFLQFIGGFLPFLDSFTTVTAMFAIILLAMRNKLQWILWVAVNIGSMCLWIMNSGFSVMFVMFAFFLMNSLIGLYINIIKPKNN